MPADIPATVVIIDGGGTQRGSDWMIDSVGNVIPQSVPRVNGNPVDATHGLPTVKQTYVPIAVTGSLTAGASGVAQSLQQAVGLPGITVVVCNPSTPVGQGVAPTESIWVDAVTIAQSTGGSTSVELIPGATMVIGPTTNAISWITYTGGHRIGAYAYM
jgi:hypothetical protein